MVLSPLSSLEHALKTILFLFISCLLLLPIQAAYAKNLDLLIEPKTLQTKLAQKSGVIIIDTRPGKAYEDGHIPGALHIDVNRTFHHYKHDKVGSIRKLDELFGHAGLTLDKEIVLYDDDEYINAGRMFWVMELIGFEKLRILNGGMKLWTAKGLPVSFDPLPLPTQTNFKPRLNVKILKTKLDARLTVASHTYFLVDARSEKNFKKGHIPSSVNIPWSANYDDKQGINVIKPVAELEALYRNIDKNQKVMTYCTKGKQSSFTYFILRYLGYMKPSHYDGSWYEWQQDPFLPKETS